MAVESDGCCWQADSVTTQAPAPGPDFTKLARRPTERLAVVQHVLSTPILQETDYLEWKTGYDLSTKPGAAAAAKHLIGFANRDFGQAGRHAGGHAYLLLGVEPGNLVGVASWDSADIENWLVRFAGPELRYDVDYVELTGKSILFLTVDSPNHGDPIYCLQRASSGPGGNALPEGTVFVRHGGKTETASAADMARLTARARATVTTLALSVELGTSGLRVIGEDVLSAATRDAYVGRERAALLQTLPAERRPGYMGYAMPHITAYSDRRTRDEFKLEVEAYVSAVASHWFTVVAVHQVENEESELVPVIVNDTDENYEDVVVELTLPFSSLCVYTGRYEADSRLNLPERPDEWGKGLLGRLSMPPIAPVRINRPPDPEVEAKEKYATLVRFPPLHVRPRTTHRLQRLLLALPPILAGKSMPVSWRATARNTPGQQRGDIELAVPGLESASNLEPCARAI